MEDNQVDLTIKIIIVGESGTGKTSIVKRYVHNYFSSSFKATLGVDFAIKKFNRDVFDVSLQIWDVGGQERFGSMTKVYYREAQGAIIVYDVTRKETFDAVEHWKADMDSKVLGPTEEPIPVVLLANKCDLPKTFQFENTETELDSYIKKNRFLAWFTTSAKDDINLQKAFECLLDDIFNQHYSRHRYGRRRVEPGVRVQESDTETEKNKCGC